MISKDELRRRLLAAQAASGVVPPMYPRPAPPPSQFQTLMSLSSDPNVPEGVRTSAGDAANRHEALARKAGVDPHEYRSGGEAAEEQGLAKRAGPDDRRQPGMPPALASPEQGLGGGGGPLPGDLAGQALVPFQPGLPPAPAPTGMVGAAVPHASQQFPVQRPAGLPLDQGIEGVGMIPPDAPEPEHTLGGIVKGMSWPSWLPSLLPPDDGKAYPLPDDVPQLPFSDDVGRESPNDTRGKAPGPSFPLASANYPVPVSKPGVPPASQGAAKPKRVGGGGGGGHAPAAPGGAQGLERLSSVEPMTPAPPAGNATKGSGGSNQPDAGTAPTYSRENEIKPLEAPKAINPLAFALIKGGAALMASNKTFGAALGDAIGVGSEAYVNAQNVDFENLRKANEDARASRKDARDEYSDTELKRWVAESEDENRKGNLGARTLESDRNYNLGIAGITERGREADQEHKLGMGNLGIRGGELGVAQGQLGVAQGNLEVNRQQLTPPDSREVMAITQQLMGMYPEMRANPKAAYEKAFEYYGKLHPAPSYGLGGLEGLMQGPAAIPGAAVSGAVPR